MDTKVTGSAWSASLWKNWLLLGSILLNSCHNSLLLKCRNWSSNTSRAADPRAQVLKELAARPSIQRRVRPLCGPAAGIEFLIAGDAERQLTEGSVKLKVRERTRELSVQVAGSVQRRLQSLLQAFPQILVQSTAGSSEAQKLCRLLVERLQGAMSEGQDIQ